jgi:SulP family sulfate permease
MGVLVNFVSDSVIIGFTAGAGLLISVNQLPHLLGISRDVSPGTYSIIGQVIGNLRYMHGLTVVVGLATVAVMVILRNWRPSWPVALIGIAGAAGAVAAFDMGASGVVVLGGLPRQLPVLTMPPLIDLELVGMVSTGALAVSAIGLVEAISISRAVASESGERLDSNQEFVGQGLANIAAGFLSGYPCSGSFTRTTLNFTSGARTPMAGVFSGLWVLIFMLLFAPLAVYLPRAALAGVVLVIAYRMVNIGEMRRILRASAGDSVIMIATMLATVFLPLEFAVLAGMLVSFGQYLVKTSTPGVWPVVPDENYRYFVHEGSGPACPQLGMMAIEGSLYFGAVHHVEEAIRANRERHPEQHLLLLRMHLVDHCDVSGIHMLEAVVRQYRDEGGDVYLVGIRPQVAAMIEASGFDSIIGSDHLLQRENAVGHLFHNVFDPSVCIYECDVRVFAECQALAKHPYQNELPPYVSIREEELDYRSARELKVTLDQNVDGMAVLDVREWREYRRSHIPQAELCPLRVLVDGTESLSKDRDILLVCRSGRRSVRAFGILKGMGFESVHVLKGGMLTWEAAGYPVMME